MRGKVQERYALVAGFLADEYPMSQMEAGERAPAIAAEYEVVRSQWANNQMREIYMRRVRGYRGYGVM
jgi:hypothetical protein